MNFSVITTRSRFNVNNFFTFGLLIFAFCLLPSHVSADVTCIGTDFPQTITVTCYGVGAYCCQDSDFHPKCCYTFVYEMWWFWLIWVFILLMAFVCGLACWRRRRAQIRYTVMANSQYPTYGTVVHTSSTNTTSGYNNPTAPLYGGNYTAAPPPDYYAQPQKPPPYPTA
ncbi:WW domain binding protein 1 [Biomphalaria glabrata]|uniref:WW domain binding protein 1-like n=1 Tax=Biomphalaria glabrata TaxID=6526 RepID=A0A2C9KG82_BIOGL|nr:WW domain binding protein 1-like [Biomphalaria glabrata]XP_013071644.1 WW domain binding protein 1-like [Biomphalaria glabrata]XP_013071653.1 WW domain binding protein 1-like [Biomphalaria glabrata]XP_055876622.1 WW domain binding protein 1-like [Biomphalaria glabrata]XP_055876623.1 WW domain binding protein 1-like [Biomphalaria glabrata]KAI8765363.1 WW domain binding protein 1-like [Biomphalaria glabrata]KAI8797349.1 WW domain binding protein 1 [Biomphalaria glabrata]